MRPRSETDSLVPGDMEASNRQITRGAAGAEDSDAVSLAQLNEGADGAAETGKYFQASGSDDSDAGAYVEGDNAVAAGEATNATGAGASAFGGGANAIAENATALGFNALAAADPSTAAGGTHNYTYYNAKLKSREHISNGQRF